MIRHLCLRAPFFAGAPCRPPPPTRPRARRCGTTLQNGIASSNYRTGWTSGGPSFQTNHASASGAGGAGYFGGGAGSVGITFNLGGGGGGSSWVSPIMATWLGFALTNVTVVADVMSRIYHP